MIDELPVWLWLPLALILWGYLALDGIARRRRSRLLHPVVHPTAVSLHRPEDRRPEDQEREKARHQDPQKPAHNPQHQHRRNRVHLIESSGA